MPGLKSTTQVGVREDLSDLIVLADQRQCAAFTMIPKGEKLENMDFDWQFDDYLEPQIDGRLSDEDRVQFENHSGRVRLKGHAQIFERAPKVGRLAEKVNNVAGMGVKKEMAKCVAKALVVTKRDIECAILSAREGQAEEGETPYELRGLMCWAQPTLQTDSETALPVKAQPETDAIYTGAFASLTEQTFSQTILGAIWEVTGTMEAFQALVGRELKNLISLWAIYYPDSASHTTIRRFEVETDGEDVVLRNSVDMLQGDYGSIELSATPWLHRELDLSVTANKTRARRSGLIFDPEKLEIRPHTMPNFRPFEDKGGGPRGLIEAILALACLNPKMLGVIDPQS